MGQSFVSALNQAIFQTFAQYSGIFLAVGIGIMAGIAGLIVIWRIAQRIFHGRGIDVGEIVELGIVITLGFYALEHYNAGMPGAPQGWSVLITDEMSWLENKVSLRQLDDLNDNLEAFRDGAEVPDGLEVVGWFDYLVIHVLTLIAQAVSFIITAEGFGATAFFLIIGPLFIPFFFVPKVDGIAWGWFKGLLQYSFFPVAAAITVFVVSIFLQAALGLLGSGAYGSTGSGLWTTSEDIGKNIGAYVTILSACIYMLFKIPQKVATAFSGIIGGGNVLELLAMLGIMRA